MAVDQTIYEGVQRRWLNYNLRRGILRQWIDRSVLDMNLVKGEGAAAGIGIRVIRSIWSFRSPRRRIHLFLFMEIHVKRNDAFSWEETSESHAFLLVEKTFDILRDIVYRVWSNDMRAVPAHATNWNVGFALELFHCRDSHFEGACLTRSVILLLACIYSFLSLSFIYACIYIYIYTYRLNVCYTEFRNICNIDKNE